MFRKKITGGPERRSLRRANVTPVNFSSDDPFWDLPVMLNQLEESCRSGDVQDVLIITRDGRGVDWYWRGESPMTTALGMLEYAKDMLLGQAR